MNLRDQRIDTLRGVCILVVLILHFHLAYRLGPGLLFRNGNYGVTVFFVISGYLITSTSLRRFGSLQSISLKRFYAFRVARIFPCLLLVLTAITLPGLAGVRYFASNKPVSFLLADLSVLTFWHNVFMAHVGYFNYGLNVLWSLSVEEVFYLLFPLLCVILRSHWLIVTLWMSVILYAPLYRFQHLGNDIEYLYANFSCFDAIAMGCCAALLGGYSGLAGRSRNVLQLLAAVLMTSVFFYKEVGLNAVWGPSLMALGAALFLFAEDSGKNIKSGKSGPIGWMGRHSYELYLFHIVVLAAMRNVLDRNALPASYKWPWFAVFLAVSFSTAWAIAHWYSEPLNRWLRKRLV